MSISERYNMAYFLGQKTAEKKGGQIQQLTSITVKTKDNETVAAKEKSPPNSNPKDTVAPQEKITSGRHSRGSSEESISETTESDSSEYQNEQDSGRATSLSSLASPVTTKEIARGTSPTFIADHRRQSKPPEGRPGEFTCSQCSKIFLKYWELQRHKMEDHTPKPGLLRPQFLCPVPGCPSDDGGYPRKVWLDQHMKKWHPEHEYEYSEESAKADENGHRRKDKGKQKEVEMVVVESESGDRELPSENAILAKTGDRAEDEVDLLILPHESQFAEDNIPDRRATIDRELSEIAGHDIETPSDATPVVVKSDTTRISSTERHLPEPTPLRSREPSITSQRQEPSLVRGSPVFSRGAVSSDSQVIPTQRSAGGRGTPSHQTTRAFTQQSFQQTSPIGQLQQPVTPLRQLPVPLINLIQQKYPGTVIYQSLTPAWAAQAQLRQRRPMMNPSGSSTQLPQDNPSEKSTHPQMQLTNHPLTPHSPSYPYSPSPYYQPLSPALHQYGFPTLYPLPPRPPPPVNGADLQQRIRVTGPVRSPGASVRPAGEPGAIFNSGNPSSTPTSSLPPPPVPQAKSPTAGPSQPPSLQPQTQTPLQPHLQPSPQTNPPQQPPQNPSQPPQESQPQPSPPPPALPQPVPQPSPQAQTIDPGEDSDREVQAQAQVHVHSPASPAPRRPKRLRPQEDVDLEESGETHPETSGSRKRRSVGPRSSSSSVHRHPLEAQDARDAMIETLLKENKGLRAQLSDMRRLEKEYLEISEELGDIRARLERGGFRLDGRGAGRRSRDDGSRNDGGQCQDNPP